MLIINESSVCAFLLTTLYLIYLIITFLHIIYFLHLLSTNYKCTQHCYFSLSLKPTAQKLKKIWSTSIWCSRRAIAPGRLPVELWCLSVVMFLRVFDLVVCKDIIQ
jgi:hypothetical protein